MTEAQTETVDWKTEYGKALQTIGFDAGQGDGKRKTPRFAFNPPEKILLVQVGHLTGVLQDISLGGIAFHLNHRLAVNRKVEVAFDRRFRAPVQVVGNYLEDFETDGFRNHHRNRSRFLDENDAYRCVVKTLGIYSWLLRI